MSAKAPNNHCFHYFDSCDEIRNVTDSECNNTEPKKESHAQGCPVPLYTHTIRIEQHENYSAAYIL